MKFLNKIKNIYLYLSSRPKLRYNGIKVDRDRSYADETSQGSSANGL